MMRPSPPDDEFEEVGYLGPDPLAGWFPEETQVDRPLGRRQGNRAQRRAAGKRKPDHQRRIMRGGGFAE
jgi:hypothetical protein